MKQLRIAVCCAVPLLAPFLGGATERWSQGVMMTLIAAVICLNPPRTSGSPKFLCLALILICLAGLPFLPAAWFGGIPWRARLIRHGVPISDMLSPQPWITAESLVLMIAGLLWVYWLGVQEWEPAERLRMAEVFVGGASLLAVTAIVPFYLNTQIPFWHPGFGFGPFPNRNQTGNFFAISGILAMACAYENVRARRVASIGFGIAFLVIFWAIILSYSRAAVIVFFAGAAVWIAALGLISRTPKFTICASSLILIGAVFLLLGGRTLERFEGPDALTLGFRGLIYQDVLTLIRSSAWCGIGLGNFEGVFALFRDRSAMESRILHPESDWLWLASETGWCGVILVLIMTGILLARVVPLERNTNRRLRLAAATGAIVFAVHGLVDVSGHRLGSMVPALFVLGLAMNNPPQAREKRPVSVGFTMAAAVLGMIGLTWAIAGTEKAILPGKIGVEAIVQRAQSWLATKQFSVANARTTIAMNWAPLDWRLYFIRGSAEAHEGNWPRAYDDFNRAKLLESTSPLVAFEEGKILLNSAPSLAIPFWRAALRRCAQSEAAAWYGQMLSYKDRFPPENRDLQTLANGHFELELVYLEQAPPDNFKSVIESILKSYPGLESLSDAQKKAFFRVWARNGGAGDLTDQVAKNPTWKRLAWGELAAHLAAEKDLKGACILAMQFMPPPVFPVAIESGVEELYRRLVVHPDDFLTGYSLYKALSDQKNDVLALEVIRKLTELKDCPSYFYFLEAEAEFRLQDYFRAWNALQRYQPIPEN